MRSIVVSIAIMGGVIFAHASMVDAVRLAAHGGHRSVVAAKPEAREVTVSRILNGSVGNSITVPSTITATDFASSRHGLLALVQGSDCAAAARECRAFVLATHTGGAGWEIVNQGNRFVSLSMVSADRGFGLTSSGAIMTTADGGHDWRVTHQFRGTDTLTFPRASLDFIDQLQGWLVLGTVLYQTEDGGSTWVRLSFHCPGRGALRGVGTGVSFVDGNHGFVLCSIGAGLFTVSLYGTADGGGVWQRISILSRVAHVSGSLDFVSPRIGFAGEGIGNLLGTTDGGRSFYPVRGVPPQGVAGVAWLSRATGYVFLSSVLMRTDDAGSHWAQVYPDVEPKGAVAFLSAVRGVGAGTAWDPGSILGTEDGGGHWSVRSSFRYGLVQGLVRQPPGTAWALVTLIRRGQEYGGVYRSRDAGRTWQLRMILGSGGTYLSFASPLIGFLGDNSAHLFQTRDGGVTWKRVPQRQITWNGQFVSASEGWAFGAGGTLLHTDDGARTWAVVPVNVQGLSLSGVFFLNEASGWLTGSQCTEMNICSGAILRTGDSGRHWDMIRFPAPFADSLNFVSADLGFANTGGVLYRTDDGGRRWRALD